MCSCQSLSHNDHVTVSAESLLTKFLMLQNVLWVPSRRGTHKANKSIHNFSEYLMKGRYPMHRLEKTRQYTEQECFSSQTYIPSLQICLAFSSCFLLLFPLLCNHSKQACNSHIKETLLNWNLYGHVLQYDFFLESISFVVLWTIQSSVRHESSTSVFQLPASAFPLLFLVGKKPFWLGNSNNKQLLLMV